MKKLNLITNLKGHFTKAGFTESNALMAEICPIPDDVLVMHNSYALMIGCVVSSKGNEVEISLIQVKEKMHSFIRKALLSLENKKGLIVDGYLLIVLNHAPETAFKDVIREIEGDTKVCRKHIVWPLEDGADLDRLQFVTILSLPDLLHGNSTNTNNFELSAGASELLHRYKELGSLDRLVDAIKSGELGHANR